MFFTSRPTEPGAIAELGAVIGHACEQSADAARVGQALLETKDADLGAAYEAGGFQKIARLWYLTRPAPRRGEFPDATPQWPEGVSVRNWTQGDDPALTRALERSYEDTLDCPELSKIRRPEEVLESHRAAGHWEPNLWWLVRLHGQPEGAMLFNPSPASDTVELVYLGLSRALRGKRLGTTLMNYALSRLVARTERSVTCAVDQRNTPACTLYERLGFVRFDERIALVRALGALGG
jgi:ribosomal protein S18 acetylase RimI-like enzyme